MDLATEDEPDAEGFMPSTAFCRALDREEEYNDVDELATGTYKGRPADARPPRGTEVGGRGCQLVGAGLDGRVGLLWGLPFHLLLC